MWSKHRHSFITAALDAGVPLSDVEDAASHADLAPPRVPPPITGLSQGYALAAAQLSGGQAALYRAWTSRSP